MGGGGGAETQSEARKDNTDCRIQGPAFRFQAQLPRVLEGCQSEMLGFRCWVLPPWGSESGRGRRRRGGTEVVVPTR